MVNESMDARDGWYTSTPLQCRHDSGYGSYSMHYRLLEFSPIRKSSDTQQTKNKVRYLGNSDIFPKSLSFLHLLSKSRCGTSGSDSGLASSVNESVSESENLPGKKAQCVKDENSNFTCLFDSATENNLHQPSKYICKNHLCEKSITSVECKKNNGPLKVFKSYAIASDLFKSEKSTKVDFFYELDIRNCTSIISDILSYLSDEDLRRANNVSQRWRDIVYSDKNSNNRRLAYIHNKKNAALGPNKENKVKIATPVERDHKSAFTSLVNVECTKQPLIFENIIQGRFDSFIQELKIEGNQETLLKCPKCRYPAKADTEFKYCCTRNLCNHEFCKKCLGPFLDNHKCTIPGLNNSLSNIIVGSKKSHKNLRRLKA